MIPRERTAALGRIRSGAQESGDSLVWGDKEEPTRLAAKRTAMHDTLPASLKFRVARGLSVPLGGAPEQVIHEAATTSSVALVFDDYIGLRPELLVEAGDRVRAGHPLLRSRTRPDMLLTAPGSGRVSSIERGSRRALRALVIELDGAAPVEFERTERGELPRLEPETARRRLLESGLWTALRERPYGSLADPHSRPRAVFVTAIDTDPLAADPAVVLADHADDFADGLQVLMRLCRVPLYLCRAAGSAVPGGDLEGVTVAEFSGPHPAGLPGTHMQRIAPVGRGFVHWYVGYQDVAAIGRLFTGGVLHLERVIALAGSQVARPRLVRTRLGANIDDLLREELLPGACRAISGSALSGREAAGWGRHLGRHHRAITVLAARDTALHGRGGPQLPVEAFERVGPQGMLITPLLRALMLRDLEASEALGCLELVEEDLALCSYVCPGKHDYGFHLRSVLDELRSRDA